MPKRYKVSYVLIDDEEFDEANNNLSFQRVVEIATPSDFDAGVSFENLIVAPAEPAPAAGRCVKCGHDGSNVEDGYCESFAEPSGRCGCYCMFAFGF